MLIDVQFWFWPVRSRNMWWPSEWCIPYWWDCSWWQWKDKVRDFQLFKDSWNYSTFPEYLCSVRPKQSVFEESFPLEICIKFYVRCRLFPAPFREKNIHSLVGMVSLCLGDLLLSSQSSCLMPGSPWDTISGWVGSWMCCFVLSCIWNMSVYCV